LEQQSKKYLEKKQNQFYQNLPSKNNQDDDFYDQNVQETSWKAVVQRKIENDLKEEEEELEEIKKELIGPYIEDVEESSGIPPA
jgi:hypothetical protein